MAADLLVLIDLGTLTGGLHAHSVHETAAGHRLPVDTIRRIACAAGIIPVVLDGNGVPIDVGRRQRLATTPQRHALRATYTGCAIAGCSRPFTHCGMHPSASITHPARSTGRSDHAA